MQEILTMFKEYILKPDDFADTKTKKILKCIITIIVIISIGVISVGGCYSFKITMKEKKTDILIKQEELLEKRLENIEKSRALNIKIDGNGHIVDKN